jgi:hypothetical protein
MKAPYFDLDFGCNSSCEESIWVMVAHGLWRDATNVTQDQLAEYLGGAEPIVECSFSEGEHKFIMYPSNPEGLRKARLLAAQLTICAAGLWGREAAPVAED